MENKVEYKNRYGDIFTFSKTEDGNILFEGEFKWMRCSWPNVYDEAYKKYAAETSMDVDGQMTLEEFKKAVHEAVYDEDGKYEHMSETSQKYAKLIYSNKNVIDMIDPSGGPYMHSGHDMGMIDDSFKGMIVQEFKPVDGNYLIIIEK